MANPDNALEELEETAFYMQWREVFNRYAVAFEGATSSLTDDECYDLIERLLSRDIREDR